MPVITLVETDKYEGCYVALKSFSDNTVVGVGDTPKIALQNAAINGHSGAVLVYVPPKDTTQILHLS